MFPGMGLDPSKLDPATLLKLNVLMQRLGPERLMRVQSLMHNLQAGFDVRKELEDFEKELPPGFREEMLAIVMSQGGSPPVVETTRADLVPTTEPSEREARLTVLRAVSAGELTPEAAISLLFP
jgi:hypothetical protein